MFAWLNRLPFQRKFLLLLTPPFLAILWFAGAALIDRLSDARSAAATEAWLNVAVEIDATTHALQLERGRSAGFVGTGGKSGGDELRAQREATDARIPMLEAAYEALGSAGDNDQGRAIKGILDKLTERSGVRGAVDKLDGSVIFPFYNTVNLTGIQTIHAIALNLDNTELARTIGAYSKLLEMKEYAGQERANLFNQLKSGLADSRRFDAMVAASRAQDLARDQFLLGASPAARAAYDGVANDPAFSRVADFRRTAQARPQKIEQVSTIFAGLSKGIEQARGGGTGAARTSFQAAADAVAAYEGLDGVTAEEKALLGTISAALAQHEGGQAADDEAALDATQALATRMIGLSADDWWEQATRRIDLLKQATDAAATDCKSVAAAQYSSAVFSLVLTGLWTVFAVLVSLGLAWRISARIGPLQDVALRLNQLAAGKLDVARLEPDGEDEVAALQTAYNDFILGLDGLVKRGGQLARGELDLAGIRKHVDRGESLASYVYVPANAGRVDLASQGPLADAFRAVETTQAQLALQAQYIAADRLSDRVLDVRLDGVLAEAFNSMTRELRQFAVQARAIAADDLQNAVLEQKRSPVEGGLGSAFADMVRGLKQFSAQASAIAAGNLSNPLLGSTTQGDLGRSFRQMIESLQLLAKQAQAIAMGDLSNASLSQRAAGDIGDNFEVMAVTLREIVATMKVSAAELSATAQELQSTSQQSQAGANEQASTIEQTKRTLATLLNSSVAIARSSQEVYDSAEVSQRTAQLMAARIAELSSHTEGIGEVVVLIKDIALKSDILALNAALEGTKAGEVGRGFSLVATQMQRLAEQVMGSIKNIEVLTNNIVRATNATVLATEDMTKLAGSTTDSARHITMSAQQQQSATQEATRAMDEIAQVARDSVSASSEIVNSARELSESAAGLETHISRFNL